MNWFQRAKRALSNDRSAPGRRLAFESLEQRWVLSHVAPGLVDAAQTYSGPLTGKVVFTSPGHGWQWNSGLNRYATDRPEYQLVEDFGTQDQMTLYADYLLRSGATVVPMRPVGRQINEVVLDNDSAGVTFTGSWSNSTGTDYYDEDYGAGADSVSYRFASTTAGAETSVATYTPNIPSAGSYPVYTWVVPSTNRTTQLYRINHTGGATEIRVDHRIVGYGWVYLGTYHFGSGSSSTLGSVQISNNSNVSGVVIADAVRFGNGMGDFTDAGAPGPSGYPREDENSYKWIQRMLGVGTTSTEAIGSGTSNVSAPSNMAQWMYRPANTDPDVPFGGAVYVGIHSNGSTGDPNTATARGAVGLIDTDAADRTPHQADLALYLGRQINQDMQALPGVFEYDWSNRTTHTFTSQFGEIDLGTSAEMDATIIEVAFHDNIQDGALLRDPRARDQIARAMYQGTLEYFDAWGGLSSPASLPTAPTNVRVVSNVSGEVTVNWAAGASTPASVNGAAATGYKVYASADGYGFDGGTVVVGTSATLTGFDPTKPYYFRVAATNAGGESKPSEVITALPSGGAKQVLIVNGFDRHDRGQDFAYPYAYTGDGLVDRVWSRYNNSFDYVVQAHTAIHAARPGVHVASTSNEAVISGAVNLADYQTVIWISGTEATVDDTFNATEQTKVTQFLAAGGNLFVSGAEIGWDLDQQNNGRTFYENTLKGNYVADDAGTYTATVNAGSIFAGLSSFVFSNGNAFSSLDGQLYNVSTPDVIAPLGGAIAALTYSGGTGGTAAIQSGPGGIGSGSIVMFGFPFEAMTNATRRQQAMGEILDFFGVGVGNPAVDIKTRVDGLDADSPTGPILAAGSSASFTYVVTNAGDVSLSSVAVNDDNGTPGNPGDDFAPTFSGGDTNGNNQLDVGETWTYTANRTTSAGQYAGIGSVAANFNATPVADSDPVHYLGAVSGINVNSLVNGQDADSPTGPTFVAGDSVSFLYHVSNTGNVALSGIVLTDDNGTPGNTADDFLPTYVNGDTNGNNQLDTNETWVYGRTRIVVAGQYAGSASVAAVDVFAAPVTDDDPLHYFGAQPGVSIETLVNGDDADAPTGPALVTGSSATFTYVVTNTGNIALGSVDVTDDNGTPGNTADDFDPTYVGGDANSNELLDTNETWTYSATHTVTLGQYTNEGSVVAIDSINQEVLDVDPANHLGIAPANADFNDDGFVNGADHVIWIKTKGMTVPAGTFGDANGDTQVDNDDYLIWQEQFGTSPGGGGSPLLSAPKAEDNVASQDAAFAELATGGIDTRRLSRGSSRPQPRAVAASSDWAALLSAIAEQKAANGPIESEPLGFCPVGRPVIELLPAEPDLARVRLVAGTKPMLPRVRR